MTVQEIYYALNPWWEGKSFDSGIYRPDYADKLATALDRKQIDVIVGSRRVGKTTVLKQLVENTLNKSSLPSDVLYLALDHPQLSNIPLSEHIRTFRSMFMHNREKRLLILLDEIQDSPDWQDELKAIYDTENVKAVVTGSTSSLLQNQGGKLTGRQIVTTVYPLSFPEFLIFRKEQIGAAEEYKYEQLVDEYLQTGGYPENVLYPSPEYLSNLLEDIIARDLIRLYKIRRPDVLKDLFRLLAASVGSRTSFTKLARVLGLSVDTVKEYIGYFESAFLVKRVEKWTPSHTEKVYTAKKIYLIDNGFKTLTTGTGDLGAKAEDAVFLHLLRNRETPSYFASQQKEVDFVLGTIKEPHPIEVKYQDSVEWEDRRLSGLRLFLREFPKTGDATIISRRTAQVFKKDNTRIRVIPMWQFLAGTR